MHNLPAPRPGSDKIELRLASLLQLHHRPDVNTRAGPEVLWLHRGVFLPGPERLRRLAGLTVREVGGLQPPRIVFILGLTLLVRRLLMGRAGGLGIEGEFGVEAGNNLLNQNGFLHGFGMGAVLCPPESGIASTRPGQSGFKGPLRQKSRAP